MTEQHKRKKTRKQFQKEEKLLAREHMMKRRHETTAFTPMHPPTITSIPQRLKDLSEIDEEDEDLVQVAPQKRKVVT